MYWWHECGAWIIEPWKFVKTNIINHSSVITRDHESQLNHMKSCENNWIKICRWLNSRHVSTWHHIQSSWKLNNNIILTNKIWALRILFQAWAKSKLKLKTVNTNKICNYRDANFSIIFFWIFDTFTNDHLLFRLSK